MKIRIQPREIDISSNDPFQEDQLGRKKTAEILAQLVSSVEGQCVLAIDAPWGAGKTTFLQMWTRHLREGRDFSVIEFNAWETDFSADPFVTLSSELTNGLEEYVGKWLTDTKIKELKETAREVFKQIVLNCIKFSTSGIIDLSQLKEKDLISYAEKRLLEYKSNKESLRKFKDVLQDIADDLAKSKNQPLVVVIDELDRCRPSYAIELLEVAKHLFTVDNVVFVIAINRLELEHSIKVLYGNDFDSRGYLRRFFDIDFRLPDPDRKAFIQTRLEQIKFSEYLDRESRSDLETVESMLLSFFGSPKISLRNVSQALHRLGLVFASLRSDRKSFAISAVVALVLLTIDSELYRKFIRSEVSDKEVVDSVYAQLGIENENLRFGKIIFEAVIILGPKENTILSSPHGGELDSPLLNNYKERLAEREKSDNTSDTSVRDHMEKVIRYVGHMKERIFRLNKLGWQDSIDRLELVASELMDEQKPEN